MTGHAILFIELVTKSSISSDTNNISTPSPVPVSATTLPTDYDAEVASFSPMPSPTSYPTDYPYFIPINPAGEEENNDAATDIDSFVSPIGGGEDSPLSVDDERFEGDGDSVRGDSPFEPGDPGNDMERFFTPLNFEGDDDTVKGDSPLPVGDNTGINGLD